MKKVLCTFLSLVLLTSCTQKHNLKGLGSNFIFSNGGITYKIEYVDCSKDSLTFNVSIENNRISDKKYHLHVKKNDYFSSVLVNDVTLHDYEKRENFYEEIKYENDFFKMKCILNEKGKKIFNSKCDVDMKFSLTTFFLPQAEGFYYMIIMLN